jgi:hypothetical protein
MDESSIKECLSSPKPKNSEGFEGISQKVLIDGPEHLIIHSHVSSTEFTIREKYLGSGSFQRQYQCSKIKATQKTLKITDQLRIYVLLQRLPRK